MVENFRSPGALAHLSPSDLEERFRQLTLLLYDTSVGINTLKERVYPYLAKDIEFIDPLLIARGGGKFKVGLSGFHSITHFDFEIFQLGVQITEKGDRGRALVDGVMNLRQLPFYTYPLRTVLAYDFDLADGGWSVRITRLEEIWSLGDLIENLPLLGPLYGVGRHASGYFFTGLFWLGWTLKGGALEQAKRWLHPG